MMGSHLIYDLINRDFLLSGSIESLNSEQSNRKVLKQEPFLLAYRNRIKRYSIQNARAYTEINLGGGKICAKRKIFFFPPLGAPRGGQNSNCKFITHGFLDIRHKYKILKRHTYSPNNYLLSTTLSLLQTKLAEKNCPLVEKFCREFRI